MNADPNNYWMQLERLERLIRASELKAGIIFSFHSLLLGLFFDRLEQLHVSFENSTLFVVLVCLWLLAVLISIYFAIQCFIPRMELKYDKNVFFFSDAVRKFGNIEAYSNKLMEVCEDNNKLFLQLSHQIHIESKIVDQKFKSVKNAMKYLAISFIFVVLVLFIWLINF